MIRGIARALLGRPAARHLKRYGKIVSAINGRADATAALTDAQLRTSADELRERAKSGASSDKLLPEAFALVREAAQRTLNMRPFDEQLLGACAIHNGQVAEMKTGEGKTLVAVMPAALHALCATPVHIVTVNDYLAQRDADWMRPAYAALGIDVGVSLANADSESKKAAYSCAVTYGTNNEFGFDLLRDNLRYTKEKTQRGLGFAIVDEVDSILIDEARTPLTISAPAGDLTPMYRACNEFARFFEKGEHTEEQTITGDFFIDEKTRAVNFSDAGYERAEELFSARGMLHAGGLYEAHNLQLMHHLVAALRARHLYRRDREYLVADGKVVIIDEHTGRPMPGRRWGDGLHQAIEAKENVAIEPESQQVASVTLQNYFRQYGRLAGMTGTALTEAEEFKQIYGLEVVPIPTHQPMIRIDANDRVYRTAAGKLRNAIDDIVSCRERNQPVLVGTISVESSEQLAAELDSRKIPYKMLTAKHHASEAATIAQAGEAGAVTIAANMAGRGTDIVLGGNPEPLYAKIRADESLTEAQRTEQIAAIEQRYREQHDAVVAAGGLRIISTERHESRRIDNQLRGRSGRQGDPGSSQFYLSFEDSLLRIFAAERISKIMLALKIEEDEALEAGMITRVIEGAQRKVEAYNYDIRKQLLEYDDIANDQRNILYAQREHILAAEPIAPLADELIVEAVRTVCSDHLPQDAPEELWDPAAAEEAFKKLIPAPVPIAAWLAADDSLNSANVAEKVIELARSEAASRAEALEDRADSIIRNLILNIIDVRWREHLAALDHLRQSIGLRGFAQKNPKQEYRREALELFNSMLHEVRLDTLRVLTSVSIREEPKPAAPTILSTSTSADKAASSAPSALPSGKRAASAAKPLRNDPCPCGSGKKYKSCHGRLR